MNNWQMWNLGRGKYQIYGLKKLLHWVNLCQKPKCRKYGKLLKKISGLTETLNFCIFPQIQFYQLITTYSLQLPNSKFSQLCLLGHSWNCLCADVSYLLWLYAEKHWTKEIGDRVCAQAISWNNAYTVYCIWYGAVVHYECRKKVIRNHEGVKFDSPKVELVWSQVTLTADCWLTYVATQWCPFYLKLSNKIAKAL